MKDQNICKFIVPREREQLIPANFIFESRVSHSGQTLTMDRHILYLAAGGEGRLCCGGKNSRLTAGMIFFSFSDLPFVIENKKGFKYYYISFSGGRADELFRRFGITPANCVFEGYEGLLPLWRDSLARSNDENIDLLSESLLLYTFSKLKRAQKAHRDTVTFVLSYLEEHFTESGLSLSQVAEAAGYHEKYLSHLFKQQFGMGFSEYLRLLRVKYAVMLMENGVTSVKNVAFLSGFSDPLYFSKIFTAAVGVSPREYRKNGGRPAEE